MTPAQEAKAEVYKELGYRLAGMVGVNLAVAGPPYGRTADKILFVRFLEP